MIATLAKFFKENGTMDKVEYRASTKVPYSYREIMKYFSSYAVMLHEVLQYKVPEEPVEVPQKPKLSTVPKKQSLKGQAKRVKEDSLDE